MPDAVSAALTAPDAAARRRECVAVGALMLFGFALRVMFVLAMEQHPPHQVPILDSAFHVDWARATAAGREYAPLAGRPFFRAPLYPWFLAAIFFAFGDGLLLPRLIQCGLGAATVGLVYAVGRRAFEPRAALLGAAIAATYWLLIYFDGELLSETLVVPLVLVALWLTLGLDGGAARARAAAAGFAWGLSALARPNVLLFVPLVPLWMLWSRRPRSIGEWIPPVLFGIGVLAPILPVTAWNTFVKGDFSLIASYGGVNLWLGNNPQSNGIDAWMPGSRSGWWEGYYDAIRLAEHALGHPLRASEVSRYYSARAWDFLWNHPDQSIPLLGRKFALFWAGEYGNNEPEVFVAHRYSRVPDLSIGYAALAPLGLLGIAIAVARRGASRLFPLWGFFAAYTASVVMFLVASRYRVPVLPVLMIFAGHALVWLFERARARAWGRLGAALLFLLAFGGWARTQGPDRTALETNGYLLLGTAEEARGNHREAVDDLRRANQLDPGRVDVLLKLAWSERKLGEHEAAIDHYRRALDLAPMQAQALEGLLDLALADGREADAEQWIADHLEAMRRRGLGENSPIAYYYRGRIRAARGDADLARGDYARALRGDPRSFRSALELGDLERDAGRWGEAATAYRLALPGLHERGASPQDDRAYAGLVEALARQGRRAESCAQASAWRARRPESSEASAAVERCSD
ncbi:MAG TPA: glycosyltransferase family 39 protein [Myxococcota bacterium]|nr:glycosyltransferase family 39 protein [Myxococcota bacterium]